MQLTTFYWHNRNVARHTSMWTQQMAATDRQYMSNDNYEFGEEDFNGEWATVYTSGGLMDMRKVQKMAEAQGLPVYGGIAKVHEAFMMGMAASIWEDMPYSEAVSEAATPVFDEQAEVYARVHTVRSTKRSRTSAAVAPGPEWRT